MCLSNGYETYAANARQIAGLFIMACLQTPMKRAQVVMASHTGARIHSRRASLERYIKFIASGAL